MDPKTLRFARTHEWARLEGDVCTIGISKFAVEQLTDVIYVELPDPGDNVFNGDSFGEIESVKAVSDLYAPVGGEVVATNDALGSEPELVNSDPYGGGWMIRVRIGDPDQVDGLLDAAAYDRLTAEG